jgi:hypothetical protein
VVFSLGCRQLTFADRWAKGVSGDRLRFGYNIHYGMRTSGE